MQFETISAYCNKKGENGMKRKWRDTDAEIRLDCETFRKVLQLVSLGEHVVRGSGIQCEEAEALCRVASDLYEKYRREFSEGRGRKGTRHIQDAAFITAQRYYERFCRETFAEALASKIAKEEYPYRGGGEERLIEHLVARHLLRQKLRAEGLEHVRLDYPQLRQDVARELRGKGGSSAPDENA